MRQTFIIANLTATSHTWTNDNQDVLTHMASRGHLALSRNLLDSYDSIPRHSMRKKSATKEKKENIDHAFDVSNLHIGLLLKQLCRCGSKINSPLNGNNGDVEQLNWRQAGIPQIMSSGVLDTWLNAYSRYDKIQQDTHKIRQDTLHLMSATICKYHLLLWRHYRTVKNTPKI